SIRPLSQSLPFVLDLFAFDRDLHSFPTRRPGQAGYARAARGTAGRDRAAAGRGGRCSARSHPSHRAGRARGSPTAAGATAAIGASTVSGAGTAAPTGDRLRGGPGLRLAS